MRVVYNICDGFPNFGKKPSAAYALTVQHKAALVEKPRTWKSKEGAQEAHEAVRPTHIVLEEAGESADEQALYRLIRLRTLASQMADALYDVRTVRLCAELHGGKNATFEAKGRVLRELGWKVLTATDAAMQDEEVTRILRKSCPHAEGHSMSFHGKF